MRVRSLRPSPLPPSSLSHALGNDDGAPEKMDLAFLPSMPPLAVPLQRRSGCCSSSSWCSILSAELPSVGTQPEASSSTPIGACANACRRPRIHPRLPPPGLAGLALRPATPTLSLFLTLSRGGGETAVLLATGLGELLKTTTPDFLSFSLLPRILLSVSVSLPVVELGISEHGEERVGEDGEGLLGERRSLSEGFETVGAAGASFLLRLLLTTTTGAATTAFCVAAVEEATALVAGGQDSRRARET